MKHADDALYAAKKAAATGGLRGASGPRRFRTSAARNPGLSAGRWKIERRARVRVAKGLVLLAPSCYLTGALNVVTRPAVRMQTLRRGCRPQRQEMQRKRKGTKMNKRKF